MEKVIARYRGKELIEAHPHREPFWMYIKAGDMMITGRDTNPEKTPSIQPGLQYIEVGAGLGGFTPDVVRYTFSAPNFVPPIIIDPIGYQGIAKLLRQGKKKASEEGRQRIETFLERCEIMLDPTKVRHYRTTLERAVANHPELHGAGDVVLDRMAATLYARYFGERDKTGAQLRTLSKGNVHVLWS